MFIVHYWLVNVWRIVFFVCSLMCVCLSLRLRYAGSWPGASSLRSAGSRTRVAGLERAEIHDNVRLSGKQRPVSRTLANFIVQIQLSMNCCWHNVYCFRLSASSRIAHLLPEEQMYLNQQSGTIRLDCFTHCLIVKCAPDITVSPRNCSCACFFF